jgi:hypothetical protein
VDAEIPHVIFSHRSDIQAPDTPGHNAGPAVGGDSALATEDDPEYQDLDDLERIGKHRDDDGVEHAAKLTHPDDDDAAMLDPEDAASNEDARVRMVGTKDKNANLDDPFNADHHSKEQLVLMEEKKDAAEEPAQPQNLKVKPSPIETLDVQTPWSEHYDFPSWDECQELKEKADGLPDLLHVPFEVSVKDVVLEGWEDEWISKARYLGPKLKEPKIDFVYTCEHCCEKHNVPSANNIRRGQRIAA